MAGFGDCPFGDFSFGETCSDSGTTQFRYLPVIMRGFPVDSRPSQNTLLFQLMEVVEKEDIALSGAIELDNMYHM